MNAFTASCYDSEPTLSSSSALLLLQGLSTNPVLRVIEALFIGTKAEYGRTPRPTKKYLIDNHSTSVCFPWMTQGNSEEIRMLPTRSRTYDLLIITYNEHKGDEEFRPCKLKGRSLNRWRIGHTRKKKNDYFEQDRNLPPWEDKLLCSVLSQSLTLGD